MLALVRKHWFHLFARSLSIGFTAVLPLVMGVFLEKLLGTSVSLLIDAYRPELTFFYAWWLLIHWMMLAYVWTDQYLDIWAITDRRIIRVDQVRLFHRQTGSFRLERLQDMNVEINGIIATLLDFGTIEAQTASGSEKEFRAPYIPKPRELKALILKEADRRMHTPTNQSL